jgi:hypothetical protein
MEEKIGLRTLQAVAHYFWFWSRAAASLLVTDSGAPTVARYVVDDWGPQLDPTTSTVWRWKGS